MTSAAQAPARLRCRWTALLRELADVVDAALGEAPKPGHDLSEHIVSHIAHYLGGNWVWLPDASSVERALRDRRIWQAFDGRNVRELSASFGLTRQQIYVILKEQRQIQIEAHRHG